eukprot:12519375-Ditylum_brightwellii.AAC.1
MQEYEYMQFPIELIPDKIIKQYNIQAIAHNGKVYAEICKGMYGLLQAGCITHAKLILHLAKHGYSPCKLTPGPWRHEHCDITFCLGIDNFGVKYTKKEDADHLIQTLKEIYTCTID